MAVQTFGGALLVLVVFVGIVIVARKNPTTLAFGVFPRSARGPALSLGLVQLLRAIFILCGFVLVVLSLFGDWDLADKLVRFFFPDA